MLPAFDVTIILQRHCPVFKFPSLLFFDTFLGRNIFQSSNKGQSGNKVHLLIPAIYPFFFIIKHHIDPIAFV